MLPVTFQVDWPFSSGEETKNIVSSHFGFPIRTILAIFDLPVTPMLPIKFRVNWPFGSGEKAKKNIFKRSSLISDQNDFSKF